MPMTAQRKPNCANHRTPKRTFKKPSSSSGLGCVFCVSISARVRVLTEFMTIMTLFTMNGISLCSQAQDRLTLVLDYLRRKYAYCFWCGTQYEDAEDMENSCPGPDEDAHD